MVGRICPVCGSRITLWQIAKPGLSREAGPVYCGSCGEVISKPWKDYLWIVPLGFLWGVMLERIISYLCSCPYYMIVFYDVILMLVSGVVILKKFPLKKQDGA